MINLLRWFARFFPQTSSAEVARTSVGLERSTTSGANSIGKSSNPPILARSSNAVKREVFFSVVRMEVFGGRLNQDRVDNLNVILDTWERLYPDADVHWIANSLAQIHHETGGKMTPIRETFADSDRQAMDRLERAWRLERLPWVRKPYWQDGWFGRGHIQLTHLPNYVKMEKRTGHPLVDRPSLLLVPSVSAEVAIIGMVEGLFTGKKLSDYSFPDDLDAPLERNPRRIINGPDGTDSKVAALHKRFLKALT
jgi:putative chitinase